MSQRQQGKFYQCQREAVYEEPSRCLSCNVLRYEPGRAVLSVLKELETIAPVVAVQGNVEADEVIRKLPIQREIVVGHGRIGVLHILGDSHNRERIARQEFPNAQCVVFGHSHIPWNQEYTGLLLFNPGSATDRRRQSRCSIGLLHLDDEAKDVRGEIVWL